MNRTSTDDFILDLIADESGRRHAMSISSPSVLSGGYSCHFDERVRELCSRVVLASEEELKPIIAELKSTLREHNQRLRELAAATLTGASRSQASTEYRA